MATVFDVANYFLAQADEDAGDTVSNLKLQKLVYYAQGFYLALKNEPLFNEPIQAWTHGPVVPALYHEFKVHGSEALPMPEEFDVNVLTAQQREILDEVYAVYGQFSAWKLRNLTHDEAPWVESYREGVNAEIKPEVLRNFFASQINA